VKIVGLLPAGRISGYVVLWFTHVYIYHPPSHLILL